MQRMILAQMPQEVPRRMRLAEHREEQVPRLPAQQIQADRGSSGDASVKRPLQPGDGDGVPVARMIPVECGMVSVFLDELIEQLGWLRRTLRPGGTRSPCEDLHAVDSLANPRLRHIKDGTAVRRAKCIER